MHVIIEFLYIIVNIVWSKILESRTAEKEPNKKNCYIERCASTCWCNMARGVL